MTYNFFLWQFIANFNFSLLRKHSTRQTELCKNCSCTHKPVTDGDCEAWGMETHPLEFNSFFCLWFIVKSSVLCLKINYHTEWMLYGDVSYSSETYESLSIINWQQFYNPLSKRNKNIWNASTTKMRKNPK